MRGLTHACACALSSTAHLPSPMITQGWIHHHRNLLHWPAHFTSSWVNTMYWSKFQQSDMFCIHLTVVHWCLDNYAPSETVISDEHEMQVTMCLSGTLTCLVVPPLSKSPSLLRMYLSHAMCLAKLCMQRHAWPGWWAHPSPTLSATRCMRSSSASSPKQAMRFVPDQSLFSIAYPCKPTISSRHVL